MMNINKKILIMFLLIFAIVFFFLDTIYSNNSNIKKRYIIFAFIFLDSLLYISDTSVGLKPSNVSLSIGWSCQ